MMRRSPTCHKEAPALGGLLVGASSSEYGYLGSLIYSTRHDPSQDSEDPCHNDREKPRTPGFSWLTIKH